MLTLKTKLNAFKGVGEKKYAKLKELGLNEVCDLLTYYPRSYIDRSERKLLMSIQDGEAASVELWLTRKDSYRRGGKRILKLTGKDGNGHNCQILYFNCDFLVNQFIIEEKYLFYGQIARKGNVWSLLHPEHANISDRERFERIEPIYPLVAGITSRDISNMMETTLNTLEPEERLPENIRQRHGLCDLQVALRGIHFPSDETVLAEARRRLVFEEFFFFQFGLMLLKGRFTEREGLKFENRAKEIQSFINSLPYQLTTEQQSAWQEIQGDMLSEKRMNRLLQGDVGSGKTVLAMLAAYLCVLNGRQAVIMAPTEILAGQHLISFEAYFKGLGIRMALLSSSVPAAKKAALKASANAGEIDILIGTHALLEEDVQLQNLGLVVTDEQHRFGVRQRSVAAGKGKSPDVLIMSATPIPRTLSLILYGDMDISLIRELPSERKPIKTHYVKPAKIQDMYGFIKKEVLEGKQVYMVCPLVEDSEVLDVNSAESLFEHLRTQVFPDLRLGLMHGRLSGSEKEQVMGAYMAHELDILVSTTVVEVGVNVPNASIMVIYDANRFGLSQLHQLRGRVGRGSEQSWCFLLADNPGQVARQRIETLVSTTSGFVIAEKDLELRGPGELLGNRQHGLPDFKIADLTQHGELLKLAQQEAKEALSNWSLDEDTASGLMKTATELFEGFSI